MKLELLDNSGRLQSTEKKIQLCTVFENQYPNPSKEHYGNRVFGRAKHILKILPVL